MEGQKDGRKDGIEGPKDGRLGRTEGFRRSSRTDLFWVFGVSLTGKQSVFCCGHTACVGCSDALVDVMDCSDPMESPLSPMEPAVDLLNQLKEAEEAREEAEEAREDAERREGWAWMYSHGMEDAERKKAGEIEALEKAAYVHDDDLEEMKQQIAESEIKSAKQQRKIQDLNEELDDEEDEANYWRDEADYWRCKFFRSTKRARRDE